MVLVACAFGLLAHERDIDAPGELRRLLKKHAQKGEANCFPCWFAPQPDSQPEALDQSPWLVEDLQQSLYASIPLAV